MKKLAKNNYDRFINILMKNGQKETARKILNKALWKLIQKRSSLFNKSTQPVKKSLTQPKPKFLLSKVLQELRSFAEVRKIYKGHGKKKRLKLVPAPVNKTRQTFLKIKWIVEAAQENSKKVSFSKKLAEEFWNLSYNKKKSKVLIKEEEVKKKVLENRSNSHFRW